MNCLVLRHFISKLYIFLNSINAVGVEIGHVSGMRYEQAVLLLPGLPLVNRPGENPEADLWTFEVETPRPSVTTGDSPSVAIDYVHPGTCACCFHVLCSSRYSLGTFLYVIGNIV